MNKSPQMKNPVAQCLQKSPAFSESHAALEQTIASLESSAEKKPYLTRCFPNVLDRGNLLPSHLYDFGIC